MLDAYIIDRLRREREQREQQDRRLPLYIPPPEPHDPRHDRQGRDEEPKDDERGVHEVDFTL